MRRPHSATHPPLLLLVAVVALGGGCAPDRVEVDPSVAERTLPAPGDPVDAELAAAGEVLFQRRCAACHRMTGPSVVGPTLEGVVERRGAEWVRGMILAPDSMLRTDSVARALLEAFRVPMPDTGLDEPRFRAVLEFLRQGPEGPTEPPGRG